MSLAERLKAHFSESKGGEGQREMCLYAVLFPLPLRKLSERRFPTGILLPDRDGFTAYGRGRDVWCRRPSNSPLFSLYGANHMSRFFQHATDLSVYFQPLDLRPISVFLPSPAPTATANVRRQLDLGQCGKQLPPSLLGILDPTTKAANRRRAPHRFVCACATSWCRLDSFFFFETEVQPRHLPRLFPTPPSHPMDVPLSLPPPPP